MDDTEATLFGSAFQMLVAATGKVQLTIVDSLKDGTTRWLVAIDRSVHWSDTLAERNK